MDERVREISRASRHHEVAVDRGEDRDARIAASHQYLASLRRLQEGEITPGSEESWSRLIAKWERAAGGDLEVLT